MRPDERPLTDDELSELQEALERAFELVGVPPGNPDAVVGAVRDRLTVAGSDEAFLLGLLLGQQICEVSGWEWTFLRYANGFEAVSVAARDRSFVCMPVHYAHKQIGRDDTIGTLFETLRKGLPAATEYAYLPLD